MSSLSVHGTDDTAGRTPKQRFSISAVGGFLFWGVPGVFGGSEIRERKFMEDQGSRNWVEKLLQACSDYGREGGWFLGLRLSELHSKPLSEIDLKIRALEPIRVEMGTSEVRGLSRCWGTEWNGMKRDCKKGRWVGTDGTEWNGMDDG